MDLNSLALEHTSDLLIYLIPGFFAAWVFHTLTSHQKESQFERIVQALIFGFIVNVLTLLTSSVLFFLSHWHSIGAWGTIAQSTWALFWALLIGLFASYLANSDRLMRFLRKRDFTRRISYPSEWYGVLYQHRGWILLQLSDGRRLHGWAEFWPTNPQEGHFYVREPAWIEANVRRPIMNCSGIMLAASKVEWLELIGDDLVE